MTVKDMIRRLEEYNPNTAWLFNADNFFAAMAQWLKEGK